jgi:hypothetical protein
MIYLAIGRRERGKTTLVYGMARKVKKRVMLDARRIIARHDADYVETRAELREGLGDLLDGDLGVNEVVYQPIDDDLDQAFGTFTMEVKHSIIQYPPTAIAIVVDEASFYRLDEARFQWLAKCTPRDRVHLLITAHRPSDIPTSIRAIADHWLIFATTQEHDVKVVEQRTSPRVAATVRQLRDRSYVHWNDAAGVMAVNDRPQDWYVSMGAKTWATQPEI